MKLFSEKVNATLTNSSLNILQIENFKEIFFGVYEIEINKSKYPVEKIYEHNGNPVVSIPIEFDGIKESYPFMLVKGKFEVFFNKNTSAINDSIFTAEEQIISEDNDIDSDFFDTSFDFADDIKNKEKILEDIRIAKESAITFANEEIKKAKELQLKTIKEESFKKEEALKDLLSSSREDLVKEFVRLSNNLKSELYESNASRFSEIEETVENKIQDLASSLDTSLKNDFEHASTLIANSINKLVDDMYSSKIIPKVNQDVSDAVDTLNEKVSEIDKNVTEKLRGKVDFTFVESVEKELDSIRDSTLELNNTINKGLQKTLSRVGNVDKKIESFKENLLNISNEFSLKIEKSENEISEIFNEKLKSIEEKTLDITDEARSYFLNLITESRNNLLSEIRQLKSEKPVEYIIESKTGEKINKDWDSIEKEWNKKIHDKFENYKTDLRKYVAVYASGGGTNAVQFQDGGVMNGPLTVHGSISASQYLGIPSSTGLYLPLSGGTLTGDLIVSNHDISTRVLSADGIKFSTTAARVATVGELTWNDEDGTLDLGLKGGNVTLQIGQKQVARVVNKTNSNLLESEYKVVRIRTSADQPPGAQGQRLAIVLAQANNDPNSVDTIGLVTENIADNQEGFVTTSGLVRNINTTGSLQGETWVDGDVLYLSPTVAGKLTNIKPEAPNHTVVVGFVVYAHQNNGKIFVKVDNGYELDELHNVHITSVSGNDILKYNSLSGVWENSNSISLSSLSANRIFTNYLDALSANITVIDIKQYELSGFNVQGNATVQGSISATGNITTLGHLAAATKAFVIPHQTKPDKQLQHGCLEGPENSVYVRGTTSNNIINLPDYWDWLVHENSVTATVTPIGKFQALYVVYQDNKKVEISGVEGKYNYTIYGTRKDVEFLEVEV